MRAQALHVYGGNMPTEMRRKEPLAPCTCPGQVFKCGFLARQKLPLLGKRRSYAFFFFFFLDLGILLPTLLLPSCSTRRP